LTFFLFQHYTICCYTNHAIKYFTDYTGRFWLVCAQGMGYGVEVSKRSKQYIKYGGAPPQRLTVFANSK
jgi:hypothetical protein